MNARAVANEFAKMRHLRVWLVMAVMVIAILGLSALTALSGPEFDVAYPGAWNVLLAGMSLAFPMVAPLLLAVLASRQVDIEHQGNGWLLSATSGVTPGGLCRSKLVSLGILVTGATLVASLLVLALGTLTGIEAPMPTVHWAGFTLCMVVVNLVVLAVQVLLSAKIENQLVALGIAVLGTLIAVFSKGFPPAFAHVTPWGYYSLAEAAGYQGAEIQTLPLSYPSIAALAVIAGLLFGLITGRLDRQEA